MTNSDYVSIWNTSYATLIANLNAIINSKLGNDNYKGIATIWRSWVYLQLTNFYGDIPYSEYAESITPGYDSQEAVLRGLLSELEIADNLLNKSGDAVEGDLLYKNDITKWKKLAKSLRLRIALQIADRDEETAKSVNSTLYADKSNLISSNNDITKFTFTSSPQWNPWASTFSTRDDQRVSKTLVDKLKQFNDPRLPIFAQLPSDNTVTEHQGAANGLSAADANNQGFNKVSCPGIYFLEDS